MFTIRKAFPRFAANAIFGLVLTQRAFPQNQNAPVWTQIMQPTGQLVEYYKYYNNGSSDAGTEQDSAYTVRPEQTYTFAGISPSTDSALSPTGVVSGYARGVCALYDRSGVYWYVNGANNFSGGGLGHIGNGTATKVNGGFDFNVSRQETGVKGIEALASFDGGPSTSSPQGAAIETVYFTDRECSDGGTEYGFYKDVVQGKLSFYYSVFSNCGILNSSGQTDPQFAHCRVTNSACVSDNPSDCTANFNNVVQQDGDGVDITNLQQNSLNTGEYKFYYHAYAVHLGSGAYIFRVELLDPYTYNLATCSFGGSTAGNCTYDMTVKSSVPISDVYNGKAGYVVAGNYAVGYVNAAQTVSYPPDITTGSVLYVKQANVGK